MSYNTKSRRPFDKDVASSSTPKYFGISGRPSVHTENPISPILSQRSKKQFYSNEDLKSSSSEDESQDISRCSFESNSTTDISDHGVHQLHKEHKYMQVPNRNHLLRVSANTNLSWTCSKQTWCYASFVFGAAIIIAAVGSVVLPNSLIKHRVNIEDLQTAFPRQLQITWDALESGIEDITKENKPSVFLILHNDSTKKVTDNLLAEVARYASCRLNNDCSTVPIHFTNDDLNTVKARTDYGYVIDRYKLELEKKSIMIVKDLNKIPGQVAQAFHSLCDEFTPLVPRTLYLFTINIENVKYNYSSDLELVEKILKNNWSDLDDDIFYPLITRITSIILRIEPEQT